MLILWDWFLTLRLLYDVHVIFRRQSSKERGENPESSSLSLNQLAHGRMSPVFPPQISILKSHNRLIFVASGILLKGLLRVCLKMRDFQILYKKWFIFVESHLGGSQMCSLPKNRPCDGCSRQRPYLCFVVFGVGEMSIKALAWRKQRESLCYVFNLHLVFECVEPI